jgi:hypothetical protein
MGHEAQAGCLAVLAHGGGRLADLHQQHAKSQQHCACNVTIVMHSNVACCASTSPCAHWRQELFGGLSARHVPQGDGSWVAVNPHEAQLLQVTPRPRLAGCTRPCMQAVQGMGRGGTKMQCTRLCTHTLKCAHTATITSVLCKP